MTMRPARLILLTSLLGVSLTTLSIAPASAADEKPAAAPVSGEKSCIPLTQIDRSQVLDDQTILFHMRGRMIYKNTLPYKCPRLGFEKAFSYATSLHQLCSSDIITVIDTFGAQTGASCGLGKFVPYTPPPRPETKKR